MNVLSVFTGAGGLDLGLEAAGFETRVCVELDAHAQRTIRWNRPQWKLADPGDIHRITPRDVLAQGDLVAGSVDLLAAGPPCQPFSASAYWAHRGRAGTADPRAATLHSLMELIEYSRPSAIVLENVRGFVSRIDDDTGLDVVRAGFDGVNQRLGTSYFPNVINIDTSAYGVPQVRRRSFVIASISGGRFEMIPPTHGSGEGLLPIRTAWDAIGDLDVDRWDSDLNPRGKWAELIGSIPEGQNYLWHTPRGDGEPLFGWRTRFWSFLLKLAKAMPSWTIQAAPGPATGPFHWRSRRLSIRELARIQTFPDTYEFPEDRTTAQRQIGNAVPCAIGELLGIEIRRQILMQPTKPKQSSLIPKHHAKCPPPEPVQPVPARYLRLRGQHLDHAGPGRGPGKVWNHNGTVESQT